jgi:hypothetical protein
MAEDATPLVEALLAIIDAAQAYLPPGRARQGRVHHPVLIDNPRINAALAAHGHPVTSREAG